MMAVFVILSLTCVINLSYILHTLNTIVFLGARDSLAMATSALNVVALGIAAYYGGDGSSTGPSGRPSIFDPLFEKFAAVRPLYPEAEITAPPWIATDHACHLGAIDRRSDHPLLASRTSRRNSFR